MPVRDDACCNAPSHVPYMVGMVQAHAAPPGMQAAGLALEGHGLQGTHVDVGQATGVPR